MRKRKRTCPHRETQDGVCGCPEFWDPIEYSQDLPKVRPSVARDTSVTLPVPTFTDYKTFKRQQSVDDAKNMTRSTSNNPQKWRPLKTNWDDGPRETSLQPQMMARNAEATQQQPFVLVDYPLPEGEARLDWDTDLVRRLFGEIQ
ncbi:hypothetical protein P153DRAFT_287286 [Dothidotthia symphoricarpi CBS 119687]|uniref:Uncharacterized protein n=1 Tax=Dothidotthia symphoricarpi CBS 119687 TaxID=1392245 RepID=A0A6A6AJ84_9PLEO|nr:uncharacterized protein P153DRAFT_287286 [Dothidotthia symphoricarpi CBS 119687]KAF2130967.1 hypothetical protein P153DRAFT_287286 [Dothidotthia symphoricarpi CBS 119687]